MPARYAKNIYAFLDGFDIMTYYNIEEIICMALSSVNSATSLPQNQSTFICLFGLKGLQVKLS